MKELLSKEHYCYRIHASSVKSTAYPPSIGNSLYMDYPPIFIRKSSSFLLWGDFLMSLSLFVGFTRMLLTILASSVLIGSQVFSKLTKLMALSLRLSSSSRTISWLRSTSLSTLSKSDPPYKCNESSEWVNSGKSLRTFLVWNSVIVNLREWGLHYTFLSIKLTSLYFNY